MSSMLEALFLPPAPTPAKLKLSSALPSRLIGEPSVCSSGMGGEDDLCVGPGGFLSLFVVLRLGLCRLPVSLSPSRSRDLDRHLLDDLASRTWTGSTGVFG